MQNVKIEEAVKTRGFMAEGRYGQAKRAPNILAMTTPILIDHLFIAHTHYWVAIYPHKLHKTLNSC